MTFLVRIPDHHGGQHRDAARQQRPLEPKLDAFTDAELAVIQCFVEDAIRSAHTAAANDG